MKPGRELDSLVAEKVMGWKRRTVFLGIGGNPVHRFSCEALTCGDRIHTIDPKDQPYNVKGAPAYSTDIAAAWQVMFHLTKEHTVSIHYSVLEKNWVVEVVRPMKNRIAFMTADTAPHAICLVALKVVEVQI